jgi:hypothetical protein
VIQHLFNFTEIKFTLTVCKKKKVKLVKLQYCSQFPYTALPAKKSVWKHGGQSTMGYIRWICTIISGP